MATIMKDIRVDARPEDVWRAFRDVYNIHDSLARGFVTDTRRDGEDRIVTFANGVTVRERIVTLDDAARRLAYSAQSERLSHHNASFHLFAAGGNGTRILWIADLLPDAMAEVIDAMMEAGCEAMKRTLEDHG